MHRGPASVWNCILLSQLMHKTGVCDKVKLIVMLTDKVFSWDALGLESVHSLEARCSHIVIIIPWLFGKTGLASGTFIYIHGKTRKYVC